jgi:hypothetical protein
MISYLGSIGYDPEPIADVAHIVEELVIFEILKRLGRPEYDVAPMWSFDYRIRFDGSEIGILSISNLITFEAVQSDEQCTAALGDPDCFDIIAGCISAYGARHDLG